MRQLLQGCCWWQGGIKGVSRKVRLLLLLLRTHLHDSMAAARVLLPLSVTLLWCLQSSWLPIEFATHAPDNVAAGTLPAAALFTNVMVFTALVDD
jgi:hypothetical protein